MSQSIRRFHLRATAPALLILMLPPDPTRHSCALCVTSSAFSSSELPSFCSRHDLSPQLCGLVRYRPALAVPRNSIQHDQDPEWTAPVVQVKLPFNSVGNFSTTMSVFFTSDFFYLETLLIVFPSSSHDAVAATFYGRFRSYSCCNQVYFCTATTFIEICLTAALLVICIAISRTVAGLRLHRCSCRWRRDLTVTAGGMRKQ